MSRKTIHIGGRGEIEEKKSRFIAHAQPISGETDALDFLAETRKKYRDARHNCYAFTSGAHFEFQRCSDDGEPSGTAGRPILGILLNEGVHNCIVVVTRYFGGTLLGTGGLVRAYQSATQKALDASVVVERKAGQKLTIITGYGDVGKLQFLIAKEQIPVLENRFTDRVEMDVIAPENEAAAFRAKISEATGGRAEMTPGTPVEYAETGGELLTYENEMLLCPH